mmetsp:Transcript_13925/g.38168  ORF Transcript_13925/g.38168 Transcript_13925/m.38168 type:complete len:283 (+) Transcript_13925:54-902(+)
MATFIFGDESGTAVDPALDLARYIHAMNGTDAPSQIQESEAFDLALQNIDKLLTPASEKEKDREAVDSVISVVCSVFQRIFLKPGANVSQLVEKFVNKITSNSSAQPSLRLKAMSTIYNVVNGNGEARFSIFLSMVNFASAAGKDLLSMVLSHCSNLESMFTEWAVDIEKQRLMFSAIFEALKKHDNRDGAHEYRLKFLRSFQGGKDFSSALAHAQTAVVEAIANPKIYLFDYYMDLDAVKALKADPSRTKVFDLLHIFAYDDLDVYNKFYKENSAFIDGLG